jgi:Gluconate 2-dehydrogenase subunit 3
MLATARWQVNRGREKDSCCSCERLLVNGTIGAKSEGWEIAMGIKSILPVINEVAGIAGQLTRREMVRRLLAAAGAGTAWPLGAASHPIHELLRNEAVLEEAENLAAEDWRPLFLNTQQHESLIAIAESIVPGSTKADVNRFIDLLLSVDTPEHQKSFVDSLAAFEKESQRRFGKGFPSLDASQQDVLLKDVSVQLAKEDSSGGAGGENHGLSGHFENLKGWVSGAYYSSEMGMKELGWTPDRVFASFPACEHPEGHH